jgi:hypothetical protein
LPQSFQVLWTAIPTWTWISLSFVALLIAGFVTLRRRYSHIDARLQAVHEFRGKFVQYANSRGQDDEAYHWLIMHSNRMQAELGFQGIIANFRDPPFFYTNYPVVLNMLPRLRQAFGERDYFNRSGEMATMFDETLVRYSGSLLEYEGEAGARLRNPLQWFLCGVEQAVSIPLYFLRAFGVLSSITISSIQGSRLFKLGSALIVLLGLVGSGISIINDGRTAYEKALHAIGLR